jgi:hypothetical protein
MAFLATAIAQIDAANAEDPRSIPVRGETRPKDLAQGELAHEWVLRMRPDAGEALLLAARAHHLRRWQWPRSSYPDGRAGYLKWRRDLHERHAAELEAILRDVGYDDATIARALDLVRKRGLGRDEEVQVLEDALCLVFVETDFAELAGRTDPDKMRAIVIKTLAKMSDEGKALVTEIPGASDALRALGV